MSEYTLIQGDCLDILPTLRKESIDMILCDLPYGTTQCKWDSIIPLGLLWNNYKRIIKPRGAIVLTAAQPFTSALIMSNVDMFKYTWLWNKIKPTGHLNAKKQPLRLYEDVVVFYKKQCTYNPIMTPYDKVRVNKPRTPEYKGDGNQVYGTYRDIGGTFKFYYPNQEIKISNANQRGRLHPTQKPVTLFEYLIRTYTNEGDMVLDNCIGSGTTMEACQNLNRSCIGIELSQEYCEIVEKRCGVKVRSSCQTVISDE